MQMKEHKHDHSIVFEMVLDKSKPKNSHKHNI